MNAQVVTFSGGIRSGKSSVSKAVASELGWPRVSFGDHVRSIVRAQGLDSANRDTLQTVGQELVDSDAREFSRQVLFQAGALWAPGRNLIIDGLRHYEVINPLRDLVKPSNLRILFIEVPRDIRVGRASGELNASDVQRLELHPTEAQVVTIPRIANLILDGTLPIADLALTSVLWIREHDNKC